MIASLFIYPSNPPFSSKSPISLRNPSKPLNSLSLNATSNNDNTSNNENDENPTNLEKNKIKMPTPPWMNTPLFVDPDQVINLSKPKVKKKVSNFDDNKSDKSLTEKVSGRMGKKVVKQLVQSIEKLQTGTDLDTTQKNWGDFEGGILAENKVDTQKIWGEFGVGFIMRDEEEEKLGQNKVMPGEIHEREIVFTKVKKEKVVQVVYTARFLERESGGILVSIDKLKEGHAIIIYRGKNYKRSVDFRDNLLDKRQALKRSLRMQRLGSLKFFAYQREKEIEDLRHKLVNLQ